MFNIVSYNYYINNAIGNNQSIKSISILVSMKQIRQKIQLSSFYSFRVLGVYTDGQTDDY